MRMKLQIHFLAWFALFKVSLCQTKGNLTQKVRGNKGLPIFQVLSFPNIGCSTSAGLNGTCYTSSECQTKDGFVSGSCANGFGVCCTFVIGCGGVTSQNCTYFRSPTGPSAGICEAQICKFSPDVCQLRLDFNSFVITGPSTSADAVSTILFGVPAIKGVPVTAQTQCLTDTFAAATPGFSSPPVICGKNTGQHMYMDASTACSSLTFKLGNFGSGAAIVDRRWEIKVTQISCFDFNTLPPSGCTQYFYGANSGTFQSYNFDNLPPSQLARQKQNICFRQEKSYCRICFWANNPDDFAVSGMSAAKEAVFSNACCGFSSKGASTKGYDCVMIPGASSQTSRAPKSNAICGNSGLATANDRKTICSAQTPFMLSFITDNWTFAKNPSSFQGFKLSYQLQPCP